MWERLEGIRFQEGCLVNKKRSMRQELEEEMALRGRRGPLRMTRTGVGAKGIELTGRRKLKIPIFDAQ